MIKPECDQYCLGANSCYLHLRAQGFLSFLITFKRENDMESLFEVVLISGVHLDFRKGPGTSPTRRGNPWHGPSQENSPKYLIQTEKISDFLLFLSKKTCNFPIFLEICKKSENRFGQILIYTELPYHLRK